MFGLRLPLDFRLLFIFIRLQCGDGVLNCGLDVGVEIKVMVRFLYSGDTLGLRFDSGTVGIGGAEGVPDSACRSRWLTGDELFVKIIDLGLEERDLHISFASSEGAATSFSCSSIRKDLDDRPTRMTSMCRNLW